MKFQGGLFLCCCY